MVVSGNGSSIIIVGSVALAFNTFFIGLRIYTRAFVSKNLNHNDGFMSLAVVVYAALLALLILGAENGIGSHTQKATIPEIGQALKYIWFLEIIYVLLTSVMKASIAMTLLQWAQKKFHIWLLWTSIVVDVIISSVVTVYVITQCTPVSYAWEFLDQTKKGKCKPFTGQLYVGYALCITTVTLDMLFLFLPFAMLKGRGVNQRLKLYIYGLFSMGVLASLANFIRLAALVKLKGSTDQLFDAAPVFTWSAVEVSIGICVAGMIECGPLLAKYNVKGFEHERTFQQMDDDMTPMKLQDMNKSGAVVNEQSETRRGFF